MPKLHSPQPSRCASPALRFPKGWEIAERETTPETAFRNRRKFLAAAAGAGALCIFPTACSAEESANMDPAQKKWAKLYPAQRNTRYKVERELTAEKECLKYNNYYEFGSHKSISRAARKIVLQPWQVAIEGMVEKPRVLDFDTLLAAMPLQQRVLRHRCVEAWAMTVPWSGFPLKTLVEYAKPLSGARYVVFETLADKEIMPGLRQGYYPWPYREGVTIEEALNDLGFIATGAYGKPVSKQNGAPLRLLLPWKYGFKSIKAIVRISFTRKKPKTFWEEIQSAEYGFWANVNPEVPHPRWSQATERLLGSNERVPTRLFNGYGHFVASLYSGMKKNKRLFI